MKIMLLILVLIVVSAIAAYTLLESPHEFSDEECQKCHVDAVNSPEVMTAPVSELCLPCHKKLSKKASHPVDIIPEMVNVPEDLPLLNGMLTCNTCHNIHENRYTVLGIKTYFLRRPSVGMDFCISCHEVTATSNKHIEIISSAHVGSRYRIIDKSQPLDPLSMDCITCHDGSLGKTAEFEFGKGIWSHNTGSHPIGVNYNESRMKKGGLRDRSRINKKIKLFNGRIGCGTCHDMYSGLPMQLVMENTGSRLCLSCHDK